MFVPISDLTQQILLLFDTGERRLPVKVVSAVCLTGENWSSLPTVGCRQHQNPSFSQESQDNAALTVVQFLLLSLGGAKVKIKQ